MEIIIQEKNSSFSQQLNSHIKELGSLLRSATIHTQENIQEEEDSNLFSPIHIGENDKPENTECTGDTLREIPFLEVERKFSIFKDPVQNPMNKTNFLFKQEIQQPEVIKDNLRRFFNWTDEKDQIFVVRKTISLDKQLLRNSYEEQLRKNSLQRQLPQDKKISKKEKQKFTCNCKKSKCLKLYCECF